MLTAGTPNITPTTTSSFTSNSLKRKREEKDELFELLHVAKKPKLEDELENWRNLDPVTCGTDVLAWWRNNEVNYPIIGMLARKYLAVPASQASTERSFSTAKR